MAGRQLSPSLARVASTARALGDLSAEVVFIGGSIAPLLQTDPAISAVRATSDVDAVVASTSYADHGAFQARLMARGFVLDPFDAKHAHRWRSPDGTPFDVVPAGAHLGGTGSEWDQIALETAVETELEPGLKIRHASAVGFLALKWAAFWDRGAADPYASHDLEDILALIVSRPPIGREFAEAPEYIREYVCDGFRWLLDNAAYEDLVAGHLGNAQSFKSVASTLRERIGQIANV